MSHPAPDALIRVSDPAESVQHSGSVLSAARPVRVLHVHGRTHTHGVTALRSASCTKLSANSESEKTTNASYQKSRT